MVQNLANTQLRTNVLGVGGVINAHSGDHEGVTKRSTEERALANVEKKSSSTKPLKEAPMANPSFLHSNPTENKA